MNGYGMRSHKEESVLARKRSESKRLGRPKGKFSATTKLTRKEDLIREYLEKKIPQSVIARLLNVHRLTVRNYIRTASLRNLPPNTCLRGWSKHQCATAMFRWQPITPSP